ncbi:MAG: DUF2586 domain-containing protein [Anaerovoracaceae bacterium]
MLRDVNITISDGQMSGNGTLGEGVHLKIGASDIESEELIKIRGTYDANRIRYLLGLSPLADACMDSVENGAALIYCMPVKPSVPGTVNEVTHVGTGTGKVALSGTPNNSYDVVVSITAEGGLNEAAFTYSINGGYTKSEEITIPLNGSYVVENTGLTLSFTEGELKEGSFVENDSFSFKTTAPQLSNQDILKAIKKIRNLKESFEFVHIVGETSEATWAAVSAEQKTLLETYKTPLLFVLEAYKPEDKTAEAYAEELIKARKTISNYDLQIVTARGLYVCMDGIKRERNFAGIVCGFYAKAGVQQSIGRTSEFSISEDKIVKLLPEGIEEETEWLDEAGYLTFRKYIGLEGYYVTNARMICPEGSDYKYAELVRVKNKIYRKVRKEALLQMHTEIDLADVEGSLIALSKFLESPLNEMVANKEISAGRVIVADGQNADTIIDTETVNLKARFTPKGYVREFEVDLGMERLS